MLHFVSGLIRCEELALLPFQDVQRCVFVFVAIVCGCTWSVWVGLNVGYLVKATYMCRCVSWTVIVRACSVSDAVAVVLRKQCVHT